MNKNCAADKRTRGSILTALLLAFFTLSCTVLCACSTSIPAGEHLYENKDLGFAAYFPGDPTIEQSTNDSAVYGAYTVADIKAASEQGITEMVIHYSDTYARYFKSLPESEFKTIQQDAMVKDLQNFCAVNGLTLASEPVISSEGPSAMQVANESNYRKASVIIPLAYSSGSDAEVREFYFYEVKVFTDNAVSCLIGVRDTEEEARAAMESFKFV